MSSASSIFMPNYLILYNTEVCGSKSLQKLRSMTKTKINVMANINIKI